MIENTSGHRAMCHNLIVQIDVVEVKTASGIVLPEEVISKEQQHMEFGTIVAIGADCWTDKKDKANVGDKVMFGHYGGQYIKGIDGKRYRILQDLEIRTVLDNNAEGV